ncbi:MAG: hypothetical protein PHN47_08395 [Clostridia bacterium]|nr:hypothetical protein [Clostridia bacterium]
MIRIERKSEVDTNPIVNKILENPSENKKAQNSNRQNQNNFQDTNNIAQHLNPTLFRYSNNKRMLAELLRIIFCIALGSGYIYLIASYPKLNFVINICDTGCSFSILALILAIFLMFILAFLTDYVFTALDLSSVLSEGYWTAVFFVLIANVVLFFLSTKIT